MAKPLRILHVDFSRDWRGGQQQLLLLAEGLRALGCEQTIYAPEAAVGLRFQKAGFALAARNAEARAAAATAAVLHAHDGHAHTWILRASWRQRPTPLRVLSRRVAYPIRSWASRWKYRRLDLVLAVSAYVRAQVLAAGAAPGADATRVAVLPDGIDLAALAPPEAARQRLRRQAGWSPDAVWLVCLSAFTPEKGLEDLLDAFAQMPAAWQLVLAGSGAGEAALRQQAARLGLAARVHFSAAMASPADWVAAGDMLVMPSRAEGLGSAALLAMALGRPVIATRVGGIPELIADGRTGLLVPARHPAALAAACRRLQQDPELTARLRAAAGAGLRQRHDMPALAATCLALYQQRLDAAGGGVLPASPHVPGAGQ